MAAEPHPDLTASSITIQSDSENYGNNETSPSPPSSSSSPIIVYQPPTVWSLLRGAAINLFLPFVNGLMLGFGELFANEIAFRLGWTTTKVKRYCSAPQITTHGLTCLCSGATKLANEAANGARSRIAMGSDGSRKEKGKSRKPGRYDELRMISCTKGV